MSMILYLGSLSELNFNLIPETAGHLPSNFGNPSTPSSKMFLITFPDIFILTTVSLIGKTSPINLKAISPS